MITMYKEIKTPNRHHTDQLLQDKLTQTHIREIAPPVTREWGGQSRWMLQGVTPMWSFKWVNSVYSENHKLTKEKWIDLVTVLLWWLVKYDLCSHACEEVVVCRCHGFIVASVLLSQHIPTIARKHSTYLPPIFSLLNNLSSDQLWISSLFKRHVTSF